MTEEYKRFTVSLPQDLYDKFEEFRQRLDMSRSDCIRKAMTEYMLSNENIPESSSEVIGCITMIMGHEHLDFKELEHAHPHEEDHHHHDDEDDHYHDHDYSSHPKYANVQQADLLISNDIQHHYSNIIISTTHIHLEFEKCMEIIAVSGPSNKIVALKEALQKLKSVLSIGFFVVDKK